MFTSDSLSILVAFASLIVSILSILYVRKALRFEQKKYKAEQSSKRIDIKHGMLVQGETDDFMELLYEFTLLNNTDATVHIKHINVILRFISQKRFLFFFPQKLSIEIGDNGTFFHIYGEPELTHIIKHDKRFGAVIIDANNSKKLRLSENTTLKIEAVPKVHAWKAHSVISKKLIDESTETTEFFKRQCEKPTTLMPEIDNLRDSMLKNSVFLAFSPT